MDKVISVQEPLRVRTRVGVIGDIHTEVDALGWALALFAVQGVEHVLATGDIADGPYHGEGVMRACQMLRDAGAYAVLGNHDRWMLDSIMRDFPNATFLDDIDATTRDYLRGLPLSREIETPRGLLLLGHGLGTDDMATLYPYDRGPELSHNAALQQLLKAGRYRYVLGGHTHRRMVRAIEDVTFINAGAIKETREPCCLVLDFEHEVAQFYDFVRGKTVTGPEYKL
ncbi:MAG TPA: metallophosphoesterase family protein [Polyangiales bacterium]|nr:metallophosphoesterase family protein [Polyangiales bacterium]